MPNCRSASHSLAIVALLGWLATGCIAAETAAYPGKERLSVLVISEPHDLPGGPVAERALIEAFTNIRFSAIPVPYDGGDHTLDVDGLMGRDPRWIATRKVAILAALNKPWDAVFFRPGRNTRHVDADIQKALAGAVQRGIPLFWFAGKMTEKGYGTVNPSIAAILPFQGEGEGEPVPYAGPDPIAGMGLEQAGISLRGRAEKPGNGFAVVHSVVSGRDTIPLVACRRFGAGTVVAIQTNGGLFPGLSNSEVDGEMLWAEALERLVRFARDGKTAPPVVMSIVKQPADKPAPPPGALRVSLAGPAGLKVRLEQDDQRGARRVLLPSVQLADAAVEVEVQLSPSPYRWQAIRAVPSTPAALPGAVFAELDLPVKLDMETTAQGLPPDYKTRTHVSVAPGVYTGPATLAVRVVDWAGKTVSFRQEAIELAAEARVERDVDFAIEDPDSRAYIYWVRAIVMDDKGNALAHAQSKLYRYRPYDLTEKLQLATWHTENCTALRDYQDVFLKHLKDVGFTAVFGARDIDAVERANLRLYMEHQADTTLGVGAANFNSAIEGYQERYQKEGAARAVMTRSGTSDRKWPSAAMNMFSMGEETGYGMWSEAYPWRNQEAAPEECNKWFRYYLQQIYGNDLAKLNAAWGRGFKAWDEIKVWRKYAEPFGWMFMPPPRDLEPNLTPYVDTHAFHEWYFEEYARNMMAGLQRANPVPSWTLSYDFTFIHYSPAPVTNFYCALPPECVAVWHAFVRTRTPGPANPFHLDWMFYEDEGMNNQFLQMGYALGCTYLSTWGHVFNADLTPTRPGMTIKRTMKALERPEAVVRSMRPHYDGQIGIYTFDSRWQLVRGRYGFFTQRGGPDDISIGVGPYKAPGASFVKPPEGPLYTALSESGYAPKYVKPDEFARCKILFLPYVEAVDADTAAKLRQYVEGGGTLIAFPVIAQYDGGGKPYERYPGAGLDELFGFTAERRWILGRCPVDFPGENAAKKAFADAWFKTSGIERTNEKEAEVLQRDAPLFFNMTMRIGGDPCHYLPEGHERLTNLAKDVVVVGRHEDGEPLFTYRAVGKGRAVCLNVLLTWPSGLQIPVTEQRETFRQAIDQLVRRLGVEPDFELQNTRGYGEGIVDFVTAQFDLPGSDVRVLSMFSDWRGRRSDARLRLRGGYTQAWDVMAGRRLVSIADATGVPEAVVTVQPGQWRLLALLKADPPAPALNLPAAAQQGTVVPLRLAADAGRTLYGRMDVWGPDGSPLEHHCRSVVATAGDAPALRLRLDDPPGEWRVRYTDAISGAHAEKRLRVAPAADARALAKAPAYPDAPLTGERLAARGPEITNAEFIGLMERLRACHLDPGPVDKRRYSYYTCESYDSRQHFCQLLAGTDWMERVEALRDYLGRGERLYLVGEDMGYEPESGVATTPARAPRILDALQSLADRGELLQVSGKPHLRLLKVGKGMMILDRRSPDAAGNSNLHLAAFHQSWLDEMKELDLLPGGKGPVTLPVGKETVRQWLLGR